jgi:large subunit ribosomal protein L14
MIYPESKLTVGDNCGAKRVKCIKILNFSKSSGAKPMSTAVVSVRKVKNSKKIVKGDICKGVLVRLKKNIQRDTGLSIQFSDNALIIIDIKNIPIASRLFGPIFKDFRFGGYPKLLMLAKTLL